MKETPILMTGANVRLILDDLKTETRRIVKPGKARFETGQRLWVRETFHCVEKYGTAGFFYRADWADEDGEPEWKWKPSIFMPRRASRLSLEITSVHTERLQEITEEGAIREGVKAVHSLFQRPGSNLLYAFAWTAYRALWQEINGPDSWAENPLVYVIGFKRVVESKVRAKL